VWLDSSLTYAANPLTGASDDLLGIVADRDVYITDNSNNEDFTLHGTVFSRTKGLTAENYDTRDRGTFNLLGGIQQYQRGPVGTFSGGGIVSGFQKNYRYDERFYVDRPPHFPTTGSYEVLSWYE
jgi:hypothetical protein